MQGRAWPERKSKEREPASDDAPRRKSKKKRKDGPRRSLIGRAAYWSLVLGLWCFIGAIGVIAWVAAHLPPIQSLEVPKRPPSIQIVGLNGRVLATRGEMGGAAVPLRELPPFLPKAFLAIEDQRFYSHWGLDPVGVARAVGANVLHRGVAQGGSTITQQLAKNLFLTQERTMQRKLQEVILAVWLERKYTKDEILDLYLNRIYFGSGAYGVEAAAQRYFGKSARNVTLSEAALLAGLVKSPSKLAPTRNYDGAERRAQIVLAAMSDAGFVTDANAKAAIAIPPKIVKQSAGGSINYVADWVMDVLDGVVGRVEQDIVVETTIDPTLQALAEKSLLDELDAEGREVRRRAGRVRRDDAAGRGARAGRRQELRREPVQSRGRGEAPAGLGVQAVRLSHRAGARAHARDDPRGQADRREGLEAGELHPRIFRPGVADQGARDVAQHRVGAPHDGSRRAVGGAHRAPARHLLEARAECLDLARHLGSLRDGAGLGLRAVRERRRRGRAARDRARAHRAAAS